MERRRLIIAFVLVLALVAIDQTVKAWLIGVLEARAYNPLEVTSFFNIVMVWNSGVSFGFLGGGEETSRLVILALTSLISVGIAVWIVKSARERLTPFALAFVLGGALGNIIDRVVRGAVADFFDFHVAGWHFWAFNIADSAITVGIVLLLVDAFFGASSESVGEDRENAP